MKALAFAVLVVALSIGGWWLASDPSLTSANSTPAASDPTAATSRGPLPASSSASGMPAPVPAATATAPPSMARTPHDAARIRLGREFDRATNLKALYDRLSTENTAEAKYYAAKTLQECMEQQRRNSLNVLAAQRETRLAPTDPKFAQRSAAFDALTTDRCSAFGPDLLNATAASALLAEAARLGDPAARLAQLEADLRQRQTAGGRDRKPVSLTPEELTALQEAVKTQDPEALRVVANAWLLWSRPDGLRVGPEQATPADSTWPRAWALLACENGLDCGNEHRAVQTGCALQGYCGAPSLDAYYQQFDLSPAAYQESVRYRELIRTAIAQGRWDWLGLATPQPLGWRAPAPSGSPPPPRK